MSNECTDRILCDPQVSKTAVTPDQPTSPETGYSISAPRHENFPFRLWTWAVVALTWAVSEQNLSQAERKATCLGSSATTAAGKKIGKSKQVFFRSQFWTPSGRVAPLTYRTSQIQPHRMRTHSVNLLSTHSTSLCCNIVSWSFASSLFGYYSRRWWSSYLISHYILGISVSIH